MNNTMCPYQHKKKVRVKGYTLLQLMCFHVYQTCITKAKQSNKRKIRMYKLKPKALILATFILN